MGGSRILDEDAVEADLVPRRSPSSIQQLARGLALRPTASVTRLWWSHLSRATPSYWRRSKCPKIKSGHAMRPHHVPGGVGSGDPRRGRKDVGYVIVGVNHLLCVQVAKQLASSRMGGEDHRNGIGLE